ncbi:proteasome subunit beta type-7 [[Candida] anglica]|uniref:Proteasome subunit beta n=1 Tax=[Candida] anglica TaxID=148631 RepID=A0ABP0EL90_9ASCO
MNHDPYKWGRPSNETYGQYNHHIANASIQNTESANLDNFPKMNTQQPIVTGTSVISLKFKDGVILAADNLGSYGSLARFNNIERLVRVGKQTVVGISGDISDLQQIERILEELETTEDIYDSDGGHELRAPHVHEYLSRVMYNRRSKMDPLWNALIVGGFNDDGSPFLRYVDLLGVTYGSSTIATGFGAHLAIPLLRQLIPYDKDYVDITEEQARESILNAMKVLFYRDARSIDKFSMVTLRHNGEASFEKNLRCEGQRWKFAKDIRGYGSAQQ